MSSTVFDGLAWSHSSTSEHTFDEALEYVKELNQNSYDGFNDWRLPTIKELITLIDFDRFNPASIFSDTVASCYWSSTTFSGFPNFAWFVLFYNGYPNYALKTTLCYVRAVRNVKTST